MANDGNNPNPNQPNGLANALGLPPLPNAPRRMQLGTHRGQQPPNQQPPVQQPPVQQQPPQPRMQLGTHRGQQVPNQQVPNQPPVQQPPVQQPPPVPQPSPEELRQAENDKRQNELKRMKNYVGEISGAQAEEALANQLDGTWILRYSDTLQQLAVSLKESDDSIKHYPTIRDTNDGPESCSRDELIKIFGPPEVTVNASLSNDTNYASLLEISDEPENPKAQEWVKINKWIKNFLSSKEGRSAAAEAPEEELKSFKTQVAQGESAAKSGDFGRALSLGRAAVELANDWLTTSGNAFGIAGELLDKIWELDGRIEQVMPYDVRFGQMLTRMKDEADELALNNLKVQDAAALLGEANRMIDDWKRSRDERQEWLQKLANAGGLKAYKLPPPKQKAEGTGTYGSVMKLTGPNSDAPSLVIKLPNDEAGALEFKHEAEIYATLGEHPNIARCLGMQKVGGKKGLVMQALKGDMDKGLTNMKSQVEDGTMSQSDYWGVVQYSVAKTLEALQFVAAKGIVHTDIKPNNIMFDDEGNIKLIDMGLAKQSGKAWGGVVGYGAPEAPLGKGTHKTDVFGMGGITYQAVEGDRFQHNREAEINSVASNDPDYWNKIHGVLASFQPGETAMHLSTPEEGGKAGNFAADTEYTKFVNWLMNPDPTQRPTAAQALQHPFLKDRLIDDSRAKKLLKEL